MASRLSEDAEKTVLLIERGPVIDSWLSRVPLLSVDFRTSWSPTYQWKSAANAVSNEISAANMVCGKALGGTSKINAHVYTRSVPGEYNAWEESGRKGWGWKDVEPYFKKSETSITHGFSNHRGSEGTVSGISGIVSSSALTCSRTGPWRNRHLTEIPFQSVDE